MSGDIAELVQSRSPVQVPRKDKPAEDARLIVVACETVQVDGPPGPCSGKSRIAPHRRWGGLVRSKNGGQLIERKAPHRIGAVDEDHERESCFRNVVRSGGYFDDGGPVTRNRNEGLLLRRPDFPAQQSDVGATGGNACNSCDSALQ